MPGEERSVSNPAMCEPTTWNEPLPDLTRIEWKRLLEKSRHRVLTEVDAMLAERTLPAVGFYDDSP